VQRLLVLLPAACLLAACGGGGSTTAAQGPVGKTIQISEKEYSLTPNSVNSPQTGTVKFELTNDGQVTHAFEVEGNGIEEKTGNIDPGQSMTLEVDLSKTGSYEIYCPIDGHKDQGMKGTLTVGASAGAGGGTTTPGTTTQQTTTSAPGY
jgi:uncharacterized cupredoxin-like copper-binding protein